MSAAPAIAAHETRDPHAELARLYEDHKRAIFAHCLRDLRRREDAEDAVQRTFVYALMSLRRGVVPEYERAWLLKIATNVCSSCRRAAARRGQVEAPRDLDALQDLVPAPQSAASVADARELREALDALPGAQRRAIVLREWQGLSYNEIGDRLGLTKPATEMLLFRARRTLARRLQEKRAAYAFNGAPLLSWLRSFIGGSVTKTTAITAAAALSAGTVPFVAPKIAAAIEHGGSSGKAAPAHDARLRTQVVRGYPAAVIRARAHTHAATGLFAATPKAIPNDVRQTQEPGFPNARGDGRPQGQHAPSASRPPTPVRPAPPTLGLPPETAEATPTAAVPSLPAAAAPLPTTPPALPQVPGVSSPDVPQLASPPSLSAPDVPELPKVDLPSVPSIGGVTLPTP
jgi:RNA polymerase sigma factor (sigma-70 family)